MYVTGSVKVFRWYITYHLQGIGSLLRVYKALLGVPMQAENITNLNTSNSRINPRNILAFRGTIIFPGWKYYHASKASLLNFRPWIKKLLLRVEKKTKEENFTEVILMAYFAVLGVLLLSLFLFVYLKDAKTSFIYWFASKCLWQPGLGWAEARSPELHLSLACECQDPSTWSHHLVVFKTTHSFGAD